MKLLRKQINEKDGTGSVVLRAEEPEDMWHVYNLIHVHDSVKTTTIRKVGALARPLLCRTAVIDSPSGVDASGRS